MPIDFPDLDSLKSRARLRDFRQPEEGETEEHYRKEFADFMRPIDMVESMEIADGRGWDKQPMMERFDYMMNRYKGK